MTAKDKKIKSYRTLKKFLTTNIQFKKASILNILNYFQVSASEILSTLLAINCDFCDKSSDENVVILFDKISGSVLQNFLSLIYTGKYTQ